MPKLNEANNTLVCERDDIYYMLGISCKYRDAIGEMTMRAGILKEALKQYEGRWKQLK